MHELPFIIIVGYSKINDNAYITVVFLVVVVFFAAAVVVVVGGGRVNSLIRGNFVKLAQQAHLKCKDVQSLIKFWVFSVLLSSWSSLTWRTVVSKSGSSFTGAGSEDRTGFLSMLMLLGFPVKWNKNYNN